MSATSLQVSWSTELSNSKKHGNPAKLEATKRRLSSVTLGKKRLTNKLTVKNMAVNNRPNGTIKKTIGSFRGSVNESHKNSTTHTNTRRMTRLKRMA